MKQSLASAPGDEKSATGNKMAGNIPGAALQGARGWPQWQCESEATTKSAVVVVT